MAKVNLMTCEGSKQPCDPYSVVGSLAWGCCEICNGRYQLTVSSAGTTQHYVLPPHKRVADE